MAWALQELRLHQQAERQGVPRAAIDEPQPHSTFSTHTHTHTHIHTRTHTRTHDGDKQGTKKAGLDVLDLVRCKAEQKQ